MKLSRILPILPLALASLPASAYDVQRIVDGIDARDSARTSETEMLMVLEDKAGNRRTRAMKAFGKVYDDREALSIHFLGPSEVKGSAFLSIDNEADEVDDDAWLYLPALNKVRRVAQTNRSDSFMGSDFSYSDITGTETDDWDYRIVDESDAVDGFDCWVLESVPAEGEAERLLRETGYERRRIWVRKDNFVIVRGQFFLAKGNKVKLMKAEDVERIGSIWTPRTITIATTKSDRILHRSTIRFSKIAYDEELDDRLFTTDALVRGL